ncbi:MAG: DUF3341 domain-containing protein [Phycisphaerales bacterium]
MPKFPKPPSRAELMASAAEYFPFVPRSRPKYVTREGKRVFGVSAEFSRTPDVYHAAEKVRDAGYTKWDVLSPFPIHGIEKAMGFKRTILPLLAAGGALTGVSGALAMQYFMNFDFPITVQGKPYGAWEPFAPITFELGVLITAFTCILSMLALNGLPRFHHPLFSKERFLKVSDDRFFICIEATDPNFDPVKTRELLDTLGADRVDLVEDED